MTAGKPKADEVMRLSSVEFDRIMGQALKVRPEEAKKQKRGKAKKAKRGQPLGKD